MCNAPCANFISTNAVRESNVICPKCQGKSKVYNSRPKNDTIRRNRKCLECGHKYTTLELLEHPAEKIARPTKPKLTLVKKKKLKHKPRFTDLDFDNMSDEELEAAIYDGRL